MKRVVSIHYHIMQSTIINQCGDYGVGWGAARSSAGGRGRVAGMDHISLGSAANRSPPLSVITPNYCLLPQNTI
ncbi:hypothetical protein J6590_012509 [Homalodisca vitripennis]|nr:hypothetical protein J6590_012509 [Homalodisca vitripennis]